MNDEIYNPLAKINIAKSIEAEILSRAAVPLASAKGMKGAGVYVLYYAGTNPNYRTIASRNKAGNFEAPIYVGKASPKGGRKGISITKETPTGRSLADRLGQHAESIEQVPSLALMDFAVRFLMVDDIWIPLGENMLIETFRPVWNRAIDGFGNKDPGRRRKDQYKSPWDVLHPGRKAMEKLADSGLSPKFLEERVQDYFAGRKLAKLPKAIVEQTTDDDAEGADT